jgi:lysine 2,3-aminomutase
MLASADRANEKRRIKYLTRIAQLPHLGDEERAELEAVAARYAFRANDYYLGLIDWSDPFDPIRQLIIPRPEELQEWGHLDASNEASITVARGTQHKYPDTALLLCNDVCGAYCRYCFRKRLFIKGNLETSRDVSEGLDYIAAHSEITDVLLTGGDPLLLAPRKLLDIVNRLRDIAHVRVIRIGSKMLAFNPWVVLDHPELLEGLSRVSSGTQRVYLVNHFDHPRELTEFATEALEAVQRAGVACANQCPLVRGINDSADTLTELFNALAARGVTPYYVFQGRPTAGNAPYEVPIVEGFGALDEARTRVSGLAGRARMVMSHELGKIEVLAVDQAHIYLRFHRAKHPEDRGRFMVFERNETAYWLDDLVPVGEVGPNVRRHLGRVRGERDTAAQPS